MITFNRLIFYISLTLLIILQFLIINSTHNWGDDFSLYIHQGEAIKNGTLEQLENANIEMMNHGKVGPYLYPIGFPFLLSFFNFSNAFDLIQFKILGILLFGSCIILTSIIFQFFFNKNTSRKLALLFGLQPCFFFQAHNILSDIPALSFALLTTAIFLQLSKIEHSDKKQIYLIISFLISSTSMLLTRSNYVFLLLGFMTYNAFLIGLDMKNKNLDLSKKKQKIKLIFISFSAIAIHLLMKNFISTGNGANEISELMFVINNPRLLISTFFSNFRYYAGMLSFGFFYPTKLQTLLLLVTTLTLIWTFRKSIFNNNNLNLIELTFYNFSSITIYLLWPFQQGERFIFINLILSIPLIYQIASKSFKPFWNSQSTNLIFIYFILQFALVYRGHISGVLRDPEGSPGTKSFNNAMMFIQKNSDSNTIILCNKPRSVHFFAKRKSYLITNDNLRLQKSHSVTLIFTRDTQEQSILKSLSKDWVIKKVFHQEPLAIYQQFQIKPPDRDSLSETAPSRRLCSCHPQCHP